MSYLVTGSAGHLGEALVRILEEQGTEVRGIDLLASPFTALFTALVGSVSPLAEQIGFKGYPDQGFADGPFPVNWLARSILVHSR